MADGQSNLPPHRVTDSRDVPAHLS